jgi:glycosyltransferase involved in cell wall biosynthesis
VSFLDRVTPVVLTWNEEANVRRTLDGLRWAREVVVVDTGSTDRTHELLGGCPNVRLVVRPFSSHHDQWNYALRDTGIRTEWVLALDADYVLSEDLIRELGALQPPESAAGYRARFVYWSLGKPLRGSLYPPKVVLFKRTRGSYFQDGHTQRLALDGIALTLRYPIHHDDRKDLGRWFRSQAGYARLEAERIHGATRLSWVDRLRSAGLMPPIAALYALLVKGTILDGRPGLYYATQRAVAEAAIALELWGRR